jgi:hypothetical protein
MMNDRMNDEWQDEWQDEWWMTEMNVKKITISRQYIRAQMKRVKKNFLIWHFAPSSSSILFWVRWFRIYKKECEMNSFFSYNLNTCRAFFLKFLRQIVYIQFLLLAFLVVKIPLLASSCLLLFLGHVLCVLISLLCVALLLTFIPRLAFTLARKVVVRLRFMIRFMIRMISLRKKDFWLNFFI